MVISAGRPYYLVLIIIKAIRNSLCVQLKRSPTPAGDLLVLMSKDGNWQWTAMIGASGSVIDGVTYWY